MTRRYETVTVAGADGGFRVMLDDRPLRTPGRRLVVLPVRELADAVAAEWRDRAGDAAAMPMTGLSAAALDRVAPRREQAIDAIAAYGQSDLLCYRAERPEDLVRLQDRMWQPLLDWCAETFAARLAVTSGIMPLRQPGAAAAAIRGAVAGHGDLAVAGLHALTVGSGSVVIALAVAGGRIGVDAAIAAAHLDEAWQVGRWGEDAEAMRRRDDIARDMRDAARFLRYVAGVNGSGGACGRIRRESQADAGHHSASG